MYGNENCSRNRRFRGGKWMPEMSVGSHLPAYDSMAVLTHFKGHMMGGFGGSNKNIGIGCADALIGKAMIHTRTGKFNNWDIDMKELGMGNDRYQLLDADNGDREITLADAVKDVVPFQA